MTRISYTPQEAPDDGQQWEDLPDDEWSRPSRSLSTSPSSSFRGSPSAVRIRRTTKQRALIATSSPSKYTHNGFRNTIRARRERDFVVDLPPQELPNAPGAVRGSTTNPLLQDPMSNRISNRIPAIDLPQQAIGISLPQRSPVGLSPREPVGTTSPKVVNMLRTSLIHVMYYIAEVSGTVVRMTKFPISITLAALVCAYGLAIMSGAIGSALRPMCSIPVVSLLCPASSGPPRPPTPGRTPQWADFPSLLNVERKSFESLLDEAVVGPGLAIEIKKAEMATSDLVTVVRVSKLNSREILADSLSEFVKDARKVGRGLTRFSSKVGGAIDNIIAVNDYALQCIEAANSKSSGLSLRRIWGRRSKVDKRAVTQAFTEAMDTLSANMQRLILEAQVSNSDLDKLEEHLNSIYDVVSREDSSIATAKEELLAQLWTKLGFNHHELKGMDNRLALLRGIDEYRKRARAHVKAALHTLETMEGDMEDLRERVTAPQLVGDAIPLDVHMKSLRSGIERLKGRRTGAKRLEEEIINRIMGSVDSDGVKVTRTS